MTPEQSKIRIASREMADEMCSASSETSTSGNRDTTPARRAAYDLYHLIPSAPQGAYRFWDQAEAIVQNTINASVASLQEEVEQRDLDINRLNQMLRDHGYGQGQIDAYTAQCEKIDALEQRHDNFREEVEQLRKDKERVAQMVERLASTQYGSVMLRRNYRGMSQTQADINDLLDFAHAALKGDKQP